MCGITNTKAVLFIAAVTVSWLTLLNVRLATASAFTPLEWQQKVTKQHPNKSLRGQRKLLYWSRDQNHDFIDDEIRERFKPNQRVNVIVDLNKCLSKPEIHDLLSKLGRITYIGKLITIVLLDDVPVVLLPHIAALPAVAMIEWRDPVYPSNRIGGRAIQAHKSNTYSPNTAEDMNLHGNYVTIAILDSGVDNSHKAFEGKFLYGYDLTTNPPTVITHPSNPDSSGHGTHVAGIALGQPTLTPDCTPPPDDGSSADCGGVATGAKLVDIKVCNDSASDPCPALIQGLDWLGMNAQTYQIRVANMSLQTKCRNYEGDDLDAKAQLVNRIVAIGIAVAVSHGNAYPYGPGRSCAVGAQITPSPGSSSFAMTVAATQDKYNMPQTIKRDDDELYNGTLSGPRTDFDPVTNPNRLALKPDFSAPGMNIISAQAGTGTAGSDTHEYTFWGGTSMAAPHVAGAAALLIQAEPAIDPGTLKDLLRRTADPVINYKEGGPSFPMVDPIWHYNVGSGIINVFDALLALKQNDVGFENCVGPPAMPGWPCQVTSPEPPWNNTYDVKTVDPSTGAPAYPRQGVEIRIKAQIHNSATVAATVLVNYGVYEFAVGNNQFFHIGTKQEIIPPGGTIWSDQLWTPRYPNHQCIQISIQYGLDSDFDNNVTQRNIEVAASVYEVRIENPFMVPARLEVRPKSNREGWKCRVSQESFVIGSSAECPQKLHVAFDAPSGALPGETANCNIAVYGTPKGSDKPILIGGVTVQTFVPKPCRIVGQVVNETNTPVSQARLVFSRAPRSKELEDDPTILEWPTVTAVTDEDGIFSVRIPTSIKYMILIEHQGIGKGQVEQRLDCGIGKKYVLSREEVKEYENQSSQEE